MSFYPNVDHPDHLTAEKELERLCTLNNISIEDCVNYYKVMTEQQRKEVMQDFSEKALRLRSYPDKMIFTNPPKLIDLKSTFRKDTGNIAIELSSYYFSYTLYDSLYAYLDKEKLLFFSAKNNLPHTIIIQPKWTNNQFFQKAKRHFQTLRNLNVLIEQTQGSNDPFVLLAKAEIKHVNPIQKG